MTGHRTGRSTVRHDGRTAPADDLFFPHLAGTRIDRVFHAGSSVKALTPFARTVWPDTQSDSSLSNRPDRVRTCPHEKRIGTLNCRFADDLCGLELIDEAAPDRSSPDPLASEVDDRSRAVASVCKDRCPRL